MIDLTGKGIEIKWSAIARNTRIYLDGQDISQHIKSLTLEADAKSDLTTLTLVCYLPKGAEQTIKGKFMVEEDNA